MAMTDKSGKVVWRADELPFGEEYQTREMPERNDRRFLGRQLDKETGLVYMGARYLDPRTGRFTQPDPVGLVDPATGKVNQQMLLNPQRLNRYVYRLNNPYRHVDPEGDFAIVGAALAAAALIASNPDTANAPRSASSPTYESHGARGMVADSAGAIALGAAGVGISKIVGKGKGLITPKKYFSGKTYQEAEEALTKKFGEPRGGGKFNKSFFNARSRRTYNLHQDPLHRGGKAHIDIRKRNLSTDHYRNRPFYLKERR